MVGIAVYKQFKTTVQAVLGHQEAASAVLAAAAEMVTLVLQIPLRTAQHKAASENRVETPPGEL